MYSFFHFKYLWPLSIILKNQRLKEEQLLHIKTLLKQVKEKDKEVEKAAEVGHEQVEVALLEKFDTMKAEEAEVQGTLK